MKVRNKITTETVVEIAEKDAKVVKISEKQSETETLKTMQAVLEKVFGLTGNEK